MKPGYATTEFWITVVVAVLTALVTSGVIPTGNPWSKFAALLAASLQGSAYVLSRGIAKSGTRNVTSVEKEK